MNGICTGLAALSASVLAHLGLLAGVGWLAGAREGKDGAAASLELARVELSPSDVEVADGSGLELPAKLDELEEGETSIPQQEAPEAECEDAVEPPQMGVRRETLLEPSLAAPAMEPPPMAASQAQIDAPPSLRETLHPTYPRSARRRGEQGTVLLRVEVAATGRSMGVTCLRSSGSAALDDAAVEAAGRARFEPAVRHGRPVASVVTLPIEFRLTGAGR